MTANSEHTKALTGKVTIVLSRVEYHLPATGRLASRKQRQAPVPLHLPYTQMRPLWSLSGSYVTQEDLESCFPGASRLSLGLGCLSYTVRKWCHLGCQGAWGGDMGMTGTGCKNSVLYCGWPVFHPES